MSPDPTVFDIPAPTAGETTTIHVPRVATPTFASLAARAGRLRDEVQLTHGEVEGLHREAQLAALDERTMILALNEPMELLDKLANDWGLSWSTVARLVRVSDTAIRKWRRGEPITAENRRRLARISALLEMLHDRFPVREPASWMEMRVAEDATVTATDLYSHGRADLIFELAGARMSPHEVLERFDQRWRTKYAVDDRFTVVEGPDNQPVIVQRRRSE